MCKVIEASDKISQAESVIEAIWMAASVLQPTEADAIQVIASVAQEKLKSAVALLEEYKNERSGHERERIAA
jgi:hypothetical protein